MIKLLSILRIPITILAYIIVALLVIVALPAAIVVYVSTKLINFIDKFLNTVYFIKLPKLPKL
jgi:hypothetical protein